MAGRAVPGFRACARDSEASLVGPRVLLRPLEVGDHAAWREVRIRSREWLEQWEPLPDPGLVRPGRATATPSGPAAAPGSASASSTPRTASACSCSTARFGGEVSLGSVLRGPFQSSFIGYWIDEAQAGHGYVPEGVALAIRYGFDTLGLHRMEAAIVPRNARSRRVAAKLGLRDEGVAQRFLQIRGVWEDHVRYAITYEEWLERRDELEQTFLT